MFTLVLQLINRGLNFTADMLIYRIAYFHKISLAKMLLLFTHLFTAVFIPVCELTNKESNFTADMLIYHIVYHIAYNGVGPFWPM